MKVDELVLGAGISGISFAHFRKQLGHAGPTLLEREYEPGGLCRTFSVGGFRFDCSGHFLHFRNAWTKDYLEHELGLSLAQSEKAAYILYRDRLIDFPFQKNIHQLPKEEFIDCLVGLFDPRASGASSFKKMLLAKYGEGICERFLFPYNEKLYACDLDTLDVEAMGRFFPHANPTEIIQNFRRADNASYNSTFFYPPLGIGSLVDAFNKSLNIHLNEEVRRIDLDNKVVETTRGEYQYQRLISTIPLNKLLKLVGNADSFLTYNRVLVFNFGLDASSPIDANWVYIPDKGTVFYRVGFYDRTPHHRTRMYVEIGLTAEGAIDVEALRSRTVEQLKRHGFITDQKIVAEHHVVMDPAYCHITRESEQKVKSLEESLKKQDVYLLGRYAKWIYCSIEDNILAARELAADLH